MKTKIMARAFYAFRAVAIILVLLTCLGSCSDDSSSDNCASSSDDKGQTQGTSVSSGGRVMSVDIAKLGLQEQPTQAKSMTQGLCAASLQNETSEKLSLEITSIKNGSCVVCLFNGTKKLCDVSFSVKDDLSIEDFSKWQVNKFLLDEKAGVTYKENEDGGVEVTISSEEAKTKTEITIPQTVAGKSVTTISSGVVSALQKVQKVTVPEGVTTIASGAFADVATLKTVELPKTITKIEEGAFSSCTSLESVELPEAITAISANAFSDCKSLKTVQLPESVAKIEEGAFSGCQSLENITIPESVTTIDKGAFSGTALKQVSLPQNVTDIGEGAFSSCTSLESVELPEAITAISANAFSGCQNLKTAQLPESVAKIEEGAFNGCQSLENVTIPESVTTIDANAFTGCKSLTTLDIPASVTLIGKSAFESCEGLTKITMQDEAATSPSATSSATRQNFVFPQKHFEKEVVSEKAKIIDSRAFYGCLSIEEVKLSDYVEAIGDSAFMSCQNLVSFNLPKNLKKVANSAFSSNPSLTTVEVPEGLTSVEFAVGTSKTSSFYNKQTAFYRCQKITQDVQQKLKDIGYTGTFTTYPPAVIKPEGFVEGNTLELDNTNEFLGGVAKSISTTPNSVLSSEITCLPATETQNAKIIIQAVGQGETTVRFSGTSKNKWTGNFADCYVIVDEKGNISIKDNKIYTWDRSSEDNHYWYREYKDGIAITKYYSSTPVTTLNIPATLDGKNVKALWVRAITKNSSIQTLNIPEGIEYIARGALSTNANLTSLVLPESLIEIGDEAIETSDSLVTVTLPSKLQKIGSGAFKKCGKLNSINFPATLKYLGSSVFSDCVSLSNIDFDPKITDIDYGDNVFNGCIRLDCDTVHKLQDLGYTGKLPTFAQDTVANLSFMSGKTTKLPQNLNKRQLVYVAQKLKDSSAINVAIDLSECSSITQLPNNLFSGAKGLTKIALPDTLVAIGSYAFCDTAIKNINIPTSVTTVMPCAFENWTKEQTINLPFTKESTPQNWQENWTGDNCQATIAYKK